MHILILGSLICIAGTIALAFAPLLEKLDRKDGETDEFTLQAKVFDPATSKAQYFDIELQHGPKSATN